MSHSTHTKGILRALGLPEDDSFGLQVDANRRFRREVSRAVAARRIKREAIALWPLGVSLVFASLLLLATMLG